jgi:hypothetical protein
LDVFRAQRGLVAQICNLPFRRFVIGNASESSSALAFADVPQNTAARQSRNQSSADFQVCCVAHFQIRKPSELHRAAGLEVGDTAGLETCATLKTYRRFTESNSHDACVALKTPMAVTPS